MHHRLADDSALRRLARIARELLPSARPSSRPAAGASTTAGRAGGGTLRSASAARRGLSTALIFVLVSMAPAASRAAGDAPDEGQSGEQPRPSGLVEDVVVTATRAGEGTPAPHSNLGQKTIDENYTAEDVPMLLQIAPSVYSFSDSGNGIGYSYMRLRGFDQRRINVTINGVPLNDAESHEVFWVDLPNFADALQDIQIQRGVGTTLYGAGAIGGSVNLETMRLSPDGGGFTAEAAIGSFGTSKVAAGWRSGLVGERWLFGLQVSRIATDGYRDQSWTRMGMAFFTAQRLGHDSLLRVNVYGGEENSHLAYEGLTRAQLAENRRQNPLSWPGEQDHFSQPHFELLHEWRPREGLELANTVYAFYGRGYFDQFRESKDWFELHLAPEYGQGEATQVFRERWIKEWDFGWIPRVSWKHAGGRLTAGAEFRRHRASHYGTVDAENLPPGTSPGFRYYDYEVPKDSTTLYLQQSWEPAPRWSLLAGLQFVHHQWKLERDLVTGISYDESYSWLAPRVGASYDAGPRWQVFASWSQSRREPAVKDLYDPQDAWDAPAFREVSPGGFASGALPEEERLDDWEFGAGYTGERVAARTTVYLMNFDNEIIYLGGINDLGQALTGNAEKSRHRGVELELTARPAPRWQVQAHATFSEDRHVRYVEDGWAGPVDYSGNRVAGFPERTARLAVAWSPEWGRIELGARHAGRIFVDNSQSRAASTDPYTVAHLDALWKLPVAGDTAYGLRLRVDNLFDAEYEPFGYNWGEPTFIPAAGRTALLMLSYKPSAR